MPLNVPAPSIVFDASADANAVVIETRIDSRWGVQVRYIIVMIDLREKLQLILEVEVTA